MRTLKVAAEYYQQFDADISLAVPAWGYGGWKSVDIDISFEKTALVVMHSWDTGTPALYPGWWRCVEYMSRAKNIAEDIFPPLLSCVRNTGFRVYHIAGPSQVLSNYPGYQRAVQLAGKEPDSMPFVDSDPVLETLHKFRAENVFVGSHNEEDVNRGFANLHFFPTAKPVRDEGVVKTAQQLYALCKADGINHLIYTGFAINWCLLLSPGGMADMSKYGIMCSAIKEAVTAVENKETAENELCKQVALWRVALAFGFVFGVDTFMNALQAGSEKQDC